MIKGGIVENVGWKGIFYLEILAVSRALVSIVPWHLPLQMNIKDTALKYFTPF